MGLSNFFKNSKRVHLYNQLEFSDCGYACIRMICRYYGWRISPEYLREISDYNRLGLSIAEMKNIFSRLGLNCQAVKVRLSELDFMPLPAILYWKKKHFVVLEKNNPEKKRYTILDPAEGKSTIKEEDFAENFISEKGFGIALLIEETPQFVINRDSVNRYESKNGFFKLMNHSYRSNRKSFISILALTFVALIADIAIPFIFQRTIDDGISRDIQKISN